MSPSACTWDGQLEEILWLTECPSGVQAGHLVLVFCGEEYPHPDTANDRSHLTGHRDTPSYLLNVSEKSTFPASLNGRFHGLLADSVQKTLTLFNDRYGMHRLYYHESKMAFYFAAEAKAILAVRPELRRIDFRGLGEFVACGCVLENRTVFDGIRVLPPASAWKFANAALKHRSEYFRPSDWEEQEPLEPESYYLQLRDIFSRNLGRYFAGNERIGMSLTGGLDTRIIMAWRKFVPGSLPCYSFGGPFRACEDVRIAKQVAHICGQTHEVISVGEDFLAKFPEYAQRTIYLTDGCADVSRAADLYVNERAATIAPVRMTGNYGGEVLRRVRAFKPIPPTTGLFHPEFLSHVDLAKHTYSEAIKGHPLSFALFRQAPWHHYGLLALEQTQLCLRSPYLDNELVQTIFRGPAASFTNNNVCLRLIKDGNADLSRIRTDRGLAGDQPRPLAVASRALLEFMVKAEYAYDYGMPQWLAKVDYMLSPFHIERLFLGRHKFYHYRVWYRDALRDYVREILLDERALARPYVRRGRLASIVAGHLRGDQNYTAAIHKILTLELLHRALIDTTV